MARIAENLEREFFVLAAYYLVGRGSLMQGSSVLEGLHTDDCGCFTGMKDSTREMTLVLQEWRCQL